MRILALAALLAFTGAFAAETTTAAPAAVNQVCPMEGGAVDAKVTATLKNGDKDVVVAFCCKGCADKAGKLDDAGKAKVAAAAAEGKTIEAPKKP
jgi:hypothetical protein